MMTSVCSLACPMPMCRRVLRWCCICCCHCCCMTPTPYPEEVLGTTRQFFIKLIIVLLGLGVCACCAYGMSQIDPELIPKGLNVITDLKVIVFQATIAYCACIHCQCSTSAHAMPTA